MLLVLFNALLQDIYYLLKLLLSLYIRIFFVRLCPKFYILVFLPKTKQYFPLMYQELDIYCL